MKVTQSNLTGTSDAHIHYFDEGVGLHKEVVSAWQKLQKAAQNAGFDLQIASGFRGFERQLSIWNRKFSNELAVKDLNDKQVDISKLSLDKQVAAVMLFSALPATSRHHWGTDLDFYSPNDLGNDMKLQLAPWEYQVNGPFANLTQWLQQHAHDFGFYFPYDKYRGGVAAEPWHMSYFPLAKKLQQSLTADVVYSVLMQCDIEAKSYILDNLPELMTQYVHNVGNTPHG